jgi:hypothetical protein
VKGEKLKVKIPDEILVFGFSWDFKFWNWDFEFIWKTVSIMQ